MELGFFYSGDVDFCVRLSANFDFVGKIVKPKVVQL